MARRLAHKQLEAEQAKERSVRAATGFVFALTYTIDALRYGPIYFETLLAAVEHRDKMIRDNECEIPMDYYDREAHLLKMAIKIEAFDRGAWEFVGGSLREVVYGVDFADGTREKVRHRP